MRFRAGCTAGALSLENIDDLFRTKAFAGTQARKNALPLADQRQVSRHGPPVAACILAARIEMFLAGY